MFIDDVSTYRQDVTEHYIVDLLGFQVSRLECCGRGDYRQFRYALVGEDTAHFAKRGAFGRDNENSFKQLMC